MKWYLGAIAMFFFGVIMTLAMWSTIPIYSGDTALDIAFVGLAWFGRIAIPVLGFTGTYALIKRGIYERKDKGI